MVTVNMLDAKSNLSRLVDAVESGAQSEIIIARGGRPAAKLVPFRKLARGRRIGAAKGKFKAPSPDKALDAAISAIFGVRASS